MHNNLNKRAYQNKQYYKHVSPNYSSEYYIINKSNNKIKPISSQSINSIHKNIHCQHKSRKHQQKQIRSNRCSSEYYSTTHIKNKYGSVSNQINKIKRVNSKVSVFIDQHYQLNIRLNPTSLHEQRMHNQRFRSQSNRYAHPHNIGKPETKQHISRQNDSLHKKLNKYSRSQSLNELNMKYINNNDIHTSTTDLHQYYNSNSHLNVKNSNEKENKNVISSYETANSEPKQKMHYKYEYKYTCLSEQALVQEVIYLRQLTQKLFKAKQKLSTKLKQYEQKYPHQIPNTSQ